MQSSNNSLEIILIKKEFTEFEEIVRQDIESISFFELKDVGTVYYVASLDKPSSWVSSFFLDDPEINGKLFNSSSKALLLIRKKFDNSEMRIFAIAFGRGKFLIKDTAIEDGFGLKTALNLIGEKNIRTISKTIIGGSQKTSIEQMPKQSTIDDFGFDRDTDLIGKVTGKIADGRKLIGTVTGSDTLIIRSKVNSSNVSDFLDDIYGYYKSTEYKKFFEWIDYIKIVKDEKLIDSLDQELVKSLLSNKNSFWMAIPEIIDWENTSGFRISGSKDILDDIYIQNIMNSFVEKTFTNIDQLKNKKIFLVDKNKNDHISWSAYKCLIGELYHKDHSYCINNGKWYEIDNDFVNKITVQYEKSKISNINFIECKQSQHESEYNTSLAESNKTEFINLDKQLVHFNKGHNDVEICDILTKNNCMIHIKKHSNSSLLSHLFDQGLVSATLLSENDTQYISKSNDIIKRITKDRDFLLSKAKKYEIVFGIICNSNNDLPNIPLFSKISFCSVKKQLELYRFVCSIKSIKLVKD